MMRFQLRPAGVRLLMVALCGLTGGLSVVMAQPAPQAPARTQIDLILIVDTSASMVGKAGGQNIFPEVKKALKDLVSSSNPGDNILLIPYDADVRSRPTAAIYGQQDKDSIHGEIDVMKAAGPWTYTAAALQKGLEEAKRLDEAQGTNKHAKVVVLLTDGLNDPPPAVRGSASEVRLSEVARRFQGMPWFVWQVQLGPKIDGGVDEAFRSAEFPNYRPVRTAAADLSKVRAEILKEIEAEKARQAAEQAEAQKRSAAAPADDGKRQVKEEAKPQMKRQTLLLWGAVAVGIVLIGIAIVMLRRRPRPHGALQYWKPGEAPRTFDLAAASKRRLRIGPPTGDLVLTDVGEHGLILTAARIEGQVLCVIEAEDGVSLKFKGQPVTRLELYDRDQFQLGAYSLQYEGEVGSRVG